MPNAAGVATSAQDPELESPAKSPRRDLLLRPQDREIADEFRRALRRRGWTRAAADKAAKTLRRFARITETGLLKASRHDVVALARAIAAGRELDSVLHTLRWRTALRHLDAFYQWARAAGLVASSPVSGIRRHSPRWLGGTAVRPGLMRAYDRLLHDPRLSARDRAVLWCLAHGLTPSEVARLRAADVDLEQRELRVTHATRSHRNGPHRIVPLSPRAVERLGPWVRERQRNGGREGQAKSGLWLFDGHHPGVRPSREFARHVVRRHALVVFPRAQQWHIRRQLNAAGFRDLLVTRLLVRGTPCDALLSITGISSLRELDRYATATVTRDRLHAAMHAARRRWSRWI